MRSRSTAGSSRSLMRAHIAHDDQTRRRVSTKEHVSALVQKRSSAIQSDTIEQLRLDLLPNDRRSRS